MGVDTFPLREVPGRDARVVLTTAYHCLPLLAQAGDLGKEFATAEAITQLQAMSAATIDWYLAPARKSMQLRGISTTKPSPLLRNSIGLSKVGDEPATTPGVIEADTARHCGPTFQGEFTRTLTMTDLVTGWTENASIRNNASKWIIMAVAALEERFPFPLLVFDLRQRLGVHQP